MRDQSRNDIFCIVYKGDILGLALAMQFCETHSACPLMQYSTIMQWHLACILLAVSVSNIPAYFGRCLVIIRRVTVCYTCRQAHGRASILQPSYYYDKVTHKTHVMTFTVYHSVYIHTCLQGCRAGVVSGFSAANFHLRVQSRSCYEH